MRKERIRTLRLLHFVESRDRYHASINAVVGFANSLGCRLKLPSANQDLAPPIFFPIISTATRRINVRTYCRTDVLIKKSLSILRMRYAKPEQIKIHINCFPLLPLQSSHSANSTLEVALMIFIHPKNIINATIDKVVQSKFLSIEDFLLFMLEIYNTLLPSNVSNGVVEILFD